MSKTNGIMKFLFLDIDGVLNHQEFYCRVFEDENGDIDQFKMKQWMDNNPYPLCEFDPVVVDRINNVLTITGAKLVLSSSWRTRTDIHEIFNKVGLPSDFDITPNFVWTHDEYCRGDEIENYLQTHAHDTYVIIDDDNNMLEKHQNNFVLCNDLYGFTDENMYQAIKILGS